MSDKPTRTPAEELRAAVTKLRCEHRFPLQPPHGSFANPGPCRLCGTPYSDDEPTVSRALSEPLTVLLNDEADRWDVEVEREDIDCSNCGEASGCDHPLEADFHTDGCEQVLVEITDDNRDADWRCDCFDHALTVARVINGGEPR